MGQCDEFACYMTQDVAQWRLLYSLSLWSLLHHVRQRPLFFFLFFNTAFLDHFASFFNCHNCFVGLMCHSCFKHYLFSQ